MQGLLARTRSLWQGLRRRSAFEAEMDEEFQAHIELRTEDLIRAGLSPGDAARRARLEFGGQERFKEESRESRGLRPFDELRGDLGYAVRSFSRTPGFLLVVTLTLALGIGATVAIFSVVHAVLIRPLPYPEPDRLVQLWQSNEREPGARNPVSLPNYLDWKRESRAFERMGAYAFNRYSLSSDGVPEQVQGSQFHAGEAFRVAGVRPLLGRVFGPEEDRDRVVVLGEELWRRRFGADPGVVGRSIRMNSADWTVVGVMPASYRFPRPDVELWTSYATIHEEGPEAFGRERQFQRVVARLAPGVSPEQAAAELRSVMRRLAERFPEENSGADVALVPLHEQLVGEVRPAFLVLLGAVAFLLLITCANVTNLLFARAAARQRELAVRVALGAGRGRLVRQFLAEGLVLASFGGTLGLLVAAAGVPVLVALAPDDIPRLEAVRLDGSTLGAALFLATVVGFLVGILPAVRAPQLGPSDALRNGARAGRGVAFGRTQRALAAFQVAVSLVLLIGAALLGRSLAGLLAVDTGLSPENVASAIVALPPAKYPTSAQQLAALGEFRERAGQLPGVQAVGYCDCLPPSGPRSRSGFLVEGRPQPSGERPLADEARIAGDFFAALRIPVLQGRGLTPADREGAPRVVLVSRKFAEQHFRGENAIGKRISFDGETWITIVGVVGDVRYRGPAEDAFPIIYHPLAQNPFPGMYLFVRTIGDPLKVIAALRRELLAQDSEIPLGDAQPLLVRQWESLAQPRLNAFLVGSFAVLALVLAGLGIYGVVSYGVTQRIPELGVRVALGATRRDVLGLVMRGGLRVALVGVGCGMVGALATAKTLSHLIFGIHAVDPISYFGVAVLLVGVTLGAAYLPARRAAHVDAMRALRAE